MNLIKANKLLEINIERDDVSKEISFLNSKLTESRKKNLPYYLWRPCSIEEDNVNNINEIALNIILNKLKNAGYLYTIKNISYPKISEIKIYWDKKNYYNDNPEKPTKIVKTLVEIQSLNSIITFEDSKSEQKQREEREAEKRELMKKREARKHELMKKREERANARSNR
jgi:hypothetical protein